MRYTGKAKPLTIFWEHRKTFQSKAATLKDDQGNRQSRREQIELLRSHLETRYKANPHTFNTWAADAHEQCTPTAMTELLRAAEDMNHEAARGSDGIPARAFKDPPFSAMK